MAVVGKHDPSKSRLSGTLLRMRISTLGGNTHLTVENVGFPAAHTPRRVKNVILHCFLVDLLTNPECMSIQAWLIAGGARSTLAISSQRTQNRKKAYPNSVESNARSNRMHVFEQLETSQNPDTHASNARLSPVFLPFEPPHPARRCSPFTALAEGDVPFFRRTPSKTSAAASSFPCEAACPWLGCRGMKRSCCSNNELHRRHRQRPSPSRPTPTTELLHDP